MINMEGKHLYIVRGIVQIHKEQGSLKCEIKILAEDVSEIQHLSGQEVTLLLIPKED